LRGLEVGLRWVEGMLIGKMGVVLGRRNEEDSLELRGR
jgi:hypothetical protein